jgi:predicted chitinase
MQQSMVQIKQHRRQRQQRQRKRLLVSGALLVLGLVAHSDKDNIMANQYRFLPDFSVFENDEQNDVSTEDTSSSIMSRNRQVDTDASGTGGDFLERFYQNLRDSFKDDDKFKQTFMSKNRPKPDISELRSYVDKVKGSSGIEDALLEATGMYNPGTPSDDNSMTIKDAPDGITIPKQPDVMVDELSSSLGSYLRNRANKGSSFVGEGVQMASAGSLSVEDMDLARMMAGQTMRKEAAEMGLPVVDMEEEAKKSAVEAARERAKKGITQSKGAPQGIMSPVTSDPRVDMAATGLNEDDPLGRVRPKARPEVEVETAEDTTPVVEDKGSAREDAIADGLEKTVPPGIKFVKAENTSAGKAERVMYQYAYEQGIKGDELRSFMAQTAHESNRFGRMQEKGYTEGNVNNISTERFKEGDIYNKEPLRAGDPMIGKFKNINRRRFVRDGVTNSEGALQNYSGANVFNSMYAGRLGNGDFASGDGSRYKGRGYIQLTGRANYRQIGEDIGIDLENNPELMLDPEIARKATVAWWKRNVRSEEPDYTNTTRVTQIVNGGLNGLDDRIELFSKYKFNAPQTSLRPRARPDTRVASK